MWREGKVDYQVKVFWKTKNKVGNLKYIFAPCERLADRLIVNNRVNVNNIYIYWVYLGRDVSFLCCPLLLSLPPVFQVPKESVAKRKVGCLTLSIEWVQKERQRCRQAYKIVRFRGVTGLCILRINATTQFFTPQSITRHVVVGVGNLMKPVRKQRGSGGGRDKVTQNLVGHRLSRLSLPIRLLKLGVITGMKAERDSSPWVSLCHFAPSSSKREHAGACHLLLLKGDKWQVNPQASLEVSTRAWLYGLTIESSRINTTEYRVVEGVVGVGTDRGHFLEKQTDWTYPSLLHLRKLSSLLMRSFVWPIARATNLDSFIVTSQEGGRGVKKRNERVRGRRQESYRFVVLPTHGKDPVAGYMVMCSSRSWSLLHFLFGHEWWVASAV